jgi:predicted transcriptional regulator
MSAKQLVIKAVRALPDDSTIEQIAEQIAIPASIERGEAEADAGKLTPHDEVVRIPLPF